MDRSQTSQSLENSSMIRQALLNNEVPPPQTHQHNTPAYCHQLAHQHSPVYNQSHLHQNQLLLNISNPQIYSTSHRHFQYCSPSSYNDYPHQHMSRSNPISTNTSPIHIAQAATSAPISIIGQPSSYQIEQIPKQEPVKETPSQIQTQSKSPGAKPKVKDVDKKQLRSPSARRPPNAPVTMQGWLHKQGSDGLMLWKKRWFVLSEYCLFYYKGSEEDKVLGSLLLPSYNVSACEPEDKINRKFAFKCEHTNMRTYILAADSHESMTQWIHALNMACTLQNTPETPTNNQKLLNLDLLSLKSSSLAATPNKSNNLNSNNSSSDTPELSSPEQQELNEYAQHVYANAPPKPRRVSEGYCSPVPELLDRYPYPRLPTVIKSPSNNYGRHIDLRHRPMMYGDKGHLVPQHVDRRTPDTYGRSNLTRYRNPIDYEDVYTEQNAYRRPLSPMTDSTLKKQYPSVNMGYPPIKGYGLPLGKINRPQNPDIMPKNLVPNISRPHSADFLEYKAGKIEPIMPKTATAFQQTRPKSSLDINSPSTSYDLSKSNSVGRNRDNDYFYSEETYAEKMRKSSQYLHKTPMKIQPVDSPERKAYRDRSNFDTKRSYPYNYQLRDAAEGPQNVNLQLVGNRSALSEGSLLYAQEMETEILERQHPIGEEHPPEDSSSSQDQFTRSASARVSQSDREESQSGDGPPGKREESMKRLLEWKQRMLLSPLNRKAHALGYQALLLSKDLPYLNPETLERSPNRTPMSTRRSSQSLVQYNSYSSDDEDNGERSSKTSMHSQAGRTLDTFPNNSDSLSHAPFTSTTDLVFSEEFETTTSILNKLFINDNINEISPETSVDSFSAMFQNPLNSNFYDNDLNEDISTLEGNYMPMSAKTSAFQSKSDTNSDITVVFNDVDPEENHYVEMTQAVDPSLIEPATYNDLNDQQQYETVCFSGGKTEPVYMEVPVTKKENSYSDNEQLPDILKSPRRYHTHKENKSDSSDADDEASKDLESLENCNNPRFSLSDTFRPASYYLGVSKTISELQDSSDSELVSPPPIPTSSPPLEIEDYTHGNRLKKEKCLHTAIQERNSDQFNNTKDKDLNLEPKPNFLTLKDLKQQGDNRTLGIRTFEQTNQFSANGDPIGELSISNVRRVTEELSTPIDFRNINYGQGNIEGEELAEADDGPAYENFMVAKKVYSIDANNQICTAVKRHLAANHLADIKLGCRPESGCSGSIDDSIITNSNRSTPLVSSIEIVSDQIDVSQRTPYYYSDISENSNLKSSLTLNNQRESINGSKKDITHIINPLKCKSPEDANSEDQDDSTNTLAAEARSVSVDFLNLTDKSDSIDKKNIYESNTFKRKKSEDLSLAVASFQHSNFIGRDRCNQFNSSGEKCVQKSYSLEGLLENVLGDNIENEIQHRQTIDNIISEGSYLWEEDSIWREQLRSVSQRHSKSMDDLDCIDFNHETSQKKQPRAITREVKYVNDILFKCSDHGHHRQPKNSKTEIKKKGSFVIDRETLRQWDLLSSAPSDDQLLQIVDAPAPQNLMVVDLGEGSSEIGDNGNIQETASGSITINTRDSSTQRDTFPRASSSKKPIASSSIMQARSTTNLDHSHANNNNSVRPTVWPKAIPYSCNPEEEYLTSQGEIAPKGKMNVYAGELLGRTHEELVLLLIQLRRQQAQTFQAIESCYNEIDTLQLHMHKMDPIKKLENLEKLEFIKHNLMELERQYEKRKPLVNLVDNMVKLGCLYKNPIEKQKMDKQLRERLEFNQQMQERRLLADERREWNRLDPNNGQLQEKVNKLYYLDRVIHDESRNLCNLQRNKENIERALIELRNRLSQGLDTPEEADEARQQQFLLESELRKIHSKLAHNSKKLEESVTRNTRLEHELVLIKRKLQSLRYQRTSPQFSNAGDSLLYFPGPNQALETDLEKMQKRIADLQKQREELSLQVRQLTDRSATSHSSQQINKHQSSSVNDAQQASHATRRRPRSFWRETDLDTMITIDHGYHCYPNSSVSPLYINTDIRPLDANELNDKSLKSSDSTSDDTATSYNPLEKQEIKTVRIVKRESERRQRDREKTFNGKCDSLTEEDDSSQNSSILFRPTSSLPQKLPPFDDHHHSLPDRGSRHKQAELSPIFKSEAARQIITEVAKKVPSAQGQRRAVPKEHRRHHTAPHDNPVIVGNREGRRARDDLDIERTLRQRIDAPDIVRSTLSNKELKYNEETIDNILSTPNKILIPERYVPEQLPQPTAEEQEKRKKKVESIKKMLSDTAIISTQSTASNTDERSVENKPNSTAKHGSASSIVEEKKQREHLLQLNQILAKQAMEISKVVAVRNLVKLPLTPQPPSTEEDEDSSPVTPLPLVQQRENYYS